MCKFCGQCLPYSLKNKILRNLAKRDVLLLLNMRLQVIHDYINVNDNFLTQFSRSILNNELSGLFISFHNITDK